MSNPITISSKTEISDKRISDLLCTALEGGVGYFSCHCGERLPEGTTIEDFEDGGKFNEAGSYLPSYGVIPLHAGGALFFEIDECDDNIENDWELSEIDSNIRVSPDNHRLTLTREKIAKGLQVFAEKYPSHWADFISENDDSTTADVFFQCCLFGELVFG